MEFSELVLKNRSCRTFDESRKISRDELVGLVALARLAPSAVNRQPLKYFLSCDDETNGKIQSMTGWGGMLPELHLPPVGHRPTGFIVICIDEAIAQNASLADKDVGIAAQTIMLGAAAMGLSGCMLGSMKPGLRDALGLDESLTISLVLGLGRGEERIEIVDAKDSTRYYRDENGTHIVPKRTLDELIVNGGAK
jgi:nitroreductase